MNYTFSNNKLLFRAGALLDILKTGLAGDFESEEGKMLTDWGAFANAKILLNSNLTLFGNLSRRTRFPTMRESYSGALNKFKANPGLKPETGILSELGINWQNEDIYFELAGFANFYNGLIDQIRLSPSDDSLKRRMRVNLSDAEIYGIDINARFQITDNLNLQGSIIFMNSRGKTADGVTNHLNNRPEILAGLIAEYSFTSALRLLIEMETTGRQFEMSPEDNAQYIEIESSSILNIRASYRLPEILGSISELSLRVNNVFDTYRLYQLGLPEPGRTLSAGLMINL
jgi:iron complex outermembrane receptor protein